MFKFLVFTGEGITKMAKLYRVVPDVTLTTLTVGYLTDITEDLLYQLGYLDHSLSDKDYGYFGIYDQGMKRETTKDDMFFFESPWSCFRCLLFFDNLYSKEGGRILEYDIPDDIVKASRKAFTNYEGYQAKGRRIPIALLQSGKEVLTEFSAELRTRVRRNCIK